MIRAKQLSTEQLIENTWDLETVESYCMICPRYMVHFSCPGHDFNIPAFLSSYENIVLFLGTYNRSTATEDPTEDFLAKRAHIEPLLMHLEKSVNESQALVAGQCRNCHLECESIFDVCRMPMLKRYSLESLGFDVAAILREFFDEPLTFDPQTMQLVFALLTKERQSDEMISLWEELLNEH